MEFRILGPLQVVADGGDEVHVGSGKQRALLARLLLDANRAVPIGGLMVAVWCHRLLSTCGWGCPHCREKNAAGAERMLAA